MKNSFLIKKIKAKNKSHNIFANTSALLLHNLLLSHSDNLSLNQLSKVSNISIGLVHKIVSQLVEDGFMIYEGVRTAKKYRLSRPKELLEKWIDYYNITERCRFRTYNVGIEKDEIIKKIRGSKYKDSVALALHSACIGGNNFTNLENTEFYLLKNDRREELEKFLKLEPVDRGYQVLLIEPYYSKILEAQKKSTPKSEITICPPLLTFLDLYHFPVRGQEQAEFLLRKHTELKDLSSFYFKKKHE